MTPEQRRENYSCDITYVTNSELGFDYLRDNLAMVCISYLGNTLLLLAPSVPNCNSFCLFYIHYVRYIIKVMNLEKPERLTI